MNEARKQAITNAVSVILNELNGGSRKEVAEAITYRLRTEHRTLQQAFWSTILLAQCDYAEFRHDMRNEQAVEFAKEVRELAKEKNFDRGGFIYV